MRYIENRDLLTLIFLFQLKKQTVKLLNCIESDLIDQSSAIRLGDYCKKIFQKNVILLIDILENMNYKNRKIINNCEENKTKNIEIAHEINTLYWGRIDLSFNGMILVFRTIP